MNMLGRVCLLLSLCALGCSDSQVNNGADMGSDAGPNNASNNGMNNPTGSDAGPDIAVCAEAKVEVSEAIPTVILLIDRSGSMEEDFGGATRWEAVYDALMARNGGIVSTFESSINFGLATYTSQDGGPSCPQLVQVNPAPMNRDAIDATYAPLDVPDGGDTPTGDALTAILPMFQGMEEMGPRVILLATDGEPDTCEEPDPQNGQDEAIAAARAAYAQGIKTFILSVGDDVSQGHLEDMARAGSGLDQNAANPPAFRANDKDGLVRALGEILGRNRSCVFALEGASVIPNMAGTGRVSLGGQQLEFDQDWSFHTTSPPCFGSEQCIELQGDACDRFLNEEAELEAIFPCEAVFIL